MEWHLLTFSCFTDHLISIFCAQDLWFNLRVYNMWSNAAKTVFGDPLVKCQKTDKSGSNGGGMNLLNVRAKENKTGTIHRLSQGGWQKC